MMLSFPCYSWYTSWMEYTPWNNVMLILTDARATLFALLPKRKHIFCEERHKYIAFESPRTQYLQFKCTHNSRCSIFHWKFFCVLCSVTDLTSTWLGTLSIVVSLGIITHSAFHQGYDQVYASLIKYKPSAKVIKKPRTKLSPV